MTQENFLTKTLRLMLAVIPITTGLMYLMGRSYHTGFFSELGVDPTMFPLFVDDILYHGFFSIALSGYLPLFWLTMLACAGVLIWNVLSYFRNSHWIKSRIQNLLRKTQPDDVGNKINQHNFIGEKLENIFFILVSILLICSVLILFWSVSESRGKEVARQWIEKRSDCKLKPISEITLENDMQKYHGYIISCGPEFCAFYVGGKSVVIRNERIAAIRTPVN